MPTDALSLIELAYRLEIPNAEWLNELAAATHERIGAGLGLLGFTYEVTSDSRLVVKDVAQIGMPPEMAGMMRQTMAMMPPDFVRRTFVRCEAVTQSQGGDEVAREHARAAMEALQAFGWYDALMIGGADPTGHGVYLGAWLGKVTALEPAEREMLSRVAVHFATAYRARRQLAAVQSRASGAAADSADAVLTPDGRVDHAVGEASERDAREWLRDAVVSIERARGRLRQENPEEAVASWRAMVSGRWTLVEEFQADGKRYLLARRNEIAVRGFEALADRERQALGYAALGHSNKMIAYEMGIAPSTVGVLLHRAARKLGARDRDELVARYHAFTR